jgi:lactobin A/cerein 7B family class IIb bacteriocin
MKVLTSEQMVKVEGGKASPEFIIMCGLMSAAIGTITFGFGALSSFACVVFAAH